MKRRGIQASLGVAAGTLAAALISTAPARAIPPPDVTDDLNEIVAADQVAIQSLFSFDTTTLTTAINTEDFFLNSAFTNLSEGNIAGALDNFGVANTTIIDALATVNEENTVTFASLYSALPLELFNAFQPG
ncbi:MAG TPA: hypothetical protein VN741_06975 [Mycobacterium sp.]|jgi:hypothetical protein|nr:hypothetical protein [Mycobacterium sp.]